MPPIPLILYRIEDHHDPKGLAVRVRKFKVIGETDCYFYVLDQDSIYCEMWDRLTPEQQKKARRRVIKHQHPGGKFHCYLDIERALASYYARKSRQASYAELNAQKAIAGMAMYNQLKKSPALLDRLLYGEELYEPNEMIEGLDWSNY